MAAGTLLDAIHAHVLAQHDSAGVSAEVVALHNEGLVDVVDAYRTLSADSSSHDFFLTRRVFEDALPDLDAPVASVMPCVVHLYEGAGRDMVAGSVVKSYERFCEQKQQRPEQALAEIEAQPEVLGSLLPTTLVAGSRIDSPRFLSHTLRLCENSDLELRRQAVFAMGKIELPEDHPSTEAALAVLVRLAETETDDQVLAALVLAVFAFLEQQRAPELRVVGLIETALVRGGDSALHSASELLALHTAGLTSSLYDLLIEHLSNVNPANRGTVDTIDHGLWRLIEIGETTRAIELLETLLVENQGDLTIGVFGGASAAMAGSPQLLGRIATRWLLRGDKVLGDALHDIISSHVHGDLALEIDVEELGEVDRIHAMFVARKAVGFLFTEPITAASLLVSLMRHAPDDQTRGELGALLDGTLLLNYTGRVRDYLLRQTELEPAEVKAVLDETLRNLEEYLEGLRSTGERPALHPTVSQLEAHRRYFASKMDESWRAARAKSPLLSLVRESVLLYGRATITYARGPDGEAQRNESPLHAQETEMEMPRLQILDPWGLDMMLRIFRAGQIES